MTWVVEPRLGSDLEMTSGVMTFIEGQTVGEVILKVRDDSLPELAENFTVRLTNVSEVCRFWINFRKKKLIISENLIIRLDL